MTTGTEWVQNAAMKDLRARFPEALHADATALAESMGISLNALIMVSVRDYLDHRRYMLARAQVALGREEARAARPARSAAAPATATAGASPPPTPQSVAQSVPRPPEGKRHPCPCGSGRPWIECHGRKGA